MPESEFIDIKHNYDKRVNRERSTLCTLLGMKRPKKGEPGASVGT
jgi:hypothetical protein